MSATPALRPLSSPAAAASVLRWPGSDVCRVVTDLAELDRLAPYWPIADDASLTARFAWARTCTVAFARGALHVLAIIRGNEVRALAPATKRRLLGLPRIMLLGVDELNEPTDLLFRDVEALELLVQRLVDGGLPLCLDRLPEDSPTVMALGKTCARRALVVIRPRGSCPHIPLNDAWREPERQLNAGRRSDLRRARRRAEKLGAVTSEILAPAPEDLDRLLDEAFQVEARSWKGEQRTALAFDPRLAAFYRRYAHVACRAGTLRLCFLRIGGRPAAMQLAFEEGGAFWLLKVGYDAEFAPCSPGILLTRETIRYAAERGLRSYEFLGEAEAWTRVWNQHERRCVSLRTYPLGARGMATLALDAAYDAANEAARKLHARNPHVRRFYDWLRATWPR